MLVRLAISIAALGLLSCTTDVENVPTDASPRTNAIDSGADIADAVSPPDSSATDATPEDTLSLDSGFADATSVDSGFQDAAPIDAGHRDASAPDATPQDAAPRDASAPDAISVDASEPDSGHQDGGRVRMCSEIESDYTMLVDPSNGRCNGANQCGILIGHCGVGLGGCHYALNVGVTQADLDALAAEWVAAGCTGPVCRCLPPPTMVRCDSGGCLAR